MEVNFDSIPFTEWDIRLDHQFLDMLINDDPSLGIEQLSDEEKSATDIIVVGREHGSRSASALANLAESYKPDLIIHEHSFTSEHTKNFATITLNGLMFDIRSVVGALSRNIPIGERALYAEEYLSSIPDRENDDIFPLVRAIRQANPKQRPFIRLMGEADAEMNSMRGHELNTAHEAAEDKKALIDDEARKIIVREDIMVHDIARIIANTRRKLPLDKIPQMNVMVVSGLFHASFLHTAVANFGVSPAGVAGRVALDDQLYNLSTASVSMLPADEILKTRVQEIRHEQQ